MGGLKCPGCGNIIEPTYDNDGQRADIKCKHCSFTDFAGR